MSRVYYGLDLFSGAGGATRGYCDGFALRGQELVMHGMDHHKQPRYKHSGGSVFHHVDVMLVLDNPDWYSWLDCFDFFHLSPPCQIHSLTSSFYPDKQSRHTDFVTPAIEILKRKWSHKPWVMENVPQAPMYSRVDQILKLCGSSFNLCGFDKRRMNHRHRQFRLHGFTVPKLPCKHTGYKPVSVYGALNSGPPGGGEEPANMAEACKLMGIDWMKWLELKEAIPPAYTEYISTAPGGLVDLLTA